MNFVNVQFSNTLQHILDFGKTIKTRNSKTKRVTGLSLIFDKTPLITARRTAWKNALREMEWFLSGSSNIKHLHEKVRHWWQPWVDDDGFIRNNYSKQFRQFKGDSGVVDQVQYIINTLKNHPNSRRNVITTWNTSEMIDPKTPITNCHGSLIQVFVEDGAVDLIMYQRSADMVLGVPHNWIQYWAFMHYIAHHSNLKVGKFTWFGGDCHIYPDHEEVAKKIIKLKSEDILCDIPDLVYNPTSKDFKAKDFSLNIDYKPIIKESLKMTV